MLQQRHPARFLLEAKKRQSSLAQDGEPSQKKAEPEARACWVDGEAASLSLFSRCARMTTRIWPLPQNVDDRAAMFLVDLFALRFGTICQVASLLPIPLQVSWWFNGLGVI